MLSPSHRAKVDETNTETTEITQCKSPIHLLSLPTSSSADSLNVQPPFLGHKAKGKGKATATVEEEEEEEPVQVEKDQDLDLSNIISGKRQRTVKNYAAPEILASELGNVGLRNTNEEGREGGRGNGRWYNH